MSTIDESLQSLGQQASKQFNECVLEELKNSNETAYNKYETFINFVNSFASRLEGQEDLSATNKLVLGKILELKSKAITRKIALARRMEDKEMYTLTREEKNHASSYHGFVSSFKKSPKIVPKDGFKSPRIVSPLVQQSRQHKQPTAELPKNLRKSLDLPRPRSSIENTRPRREERPKSVDLTVNQAALLAWDQKPRTLSPSATSASTSSIPATARRPSPYQAKPKKRYEYQQPTVNAQITLTHVKGKPKAKPRAAPKSPQLVTEGSFNNNNINSRLVSDPSPSPSTPTTKQYNDPRIMSLMEDLSGVDKQAVEQILDEIMVTEKNLKWDDLAGLSEAKRSLKETVVYPFLRPDLFNGLREPITGMLLFGPPGTGKTMIAKTVANESNATFFNISASSLLSKYLGESEKLIRALFYVAKKLSPSVVFFDEIDSLLTARADGEQESSRRVKTEFLIQWSSLSSATANEQNDTPRVLVLAATNLPWSIDEAARRRFSRRLYIPLPEFDTRLSQLKKLMSHTHHSLDDSDFILIANITEGYSNSDLTSLAKEAAMEPIRDLGEGLIDFDQKLEIRPMNFLDFEKAMNTIKKSVGNETIQRFEDWAKRYGSSGA